MTRLLLLPLILFSLGVKAEIPLDKKAHFLGGYAVSYTTASLLEGEVDLPWAAGLGLGILVGAMKELTDEHSDGGDFLASALGAASGSLLHYSCKW